MKGLVDMLQFKPKKKNKFGAIRIKTADGTTHDSKKEATRWVELNMLQKVGEIADLKRQVSYKLIPTQFGSDGKCIERSVTYKADFVYTDCNTGELVVEDVKSPATRKNKDYILKRKMMLYLLGIRIRER